MSAQFGPWKQHQESGYRRSPKHPMNAGAPRLSLALILMALVFITGTFGFVEIEKWDVWRALYFTLITITTVGYGDEGLSDSGKMFASVLLVGGVLSGSYTLGMIVQTSVANQLAWYKRMEKKISRLKGHTVVCGFGRMGFSVCTKLAARGKPFVVIERDPAGFAKAIEMGFLAIEGNASEEQELINARIAQASHVVAAVDNVAENILITMESRDLNPEAFIIARAERDEDMRKLYRAGVNRVLCPFKSGGREVADFVTRPHVADFLTQASLGDTGIALAEVRIDKSSTLIGTSLADYGRDIANHVSFVALQRKEGEVLIPPRGNHVLAEGDLLIVAGDPEQVSAMNEDAPVKSVA